MAAFKEKLAARFGSISGIAAFLGSYQVCHTICMWIVGILALLGITIVGMPLIFFQKVALPFWTLALFLFLVSLFLYIRKRCISEKLLMFNLGVILFGIPFASVQDYLMYFWIAGGIIILVSILLFVRDKFISRRKRR